MEPQRYIRAAAELSLAKNIMFSAAGGVAGLENNDPAHCF
jgi:hypothetical protein